MLLVSTFFIWLNSIVILLGFGAIFFVPKYFFIWAFFILAFLIFTFFYILRGQKVAKLDKLLFIIAPVCLLLFSFLGSIFLNSNYVKLFFALAIALLVFLYLDNLFSYYRLPAKYQIYSLENILSYLNLITIFLLSSSFYGVKTLLGINSFSLYGFTVFNFLIIFVLIYQTLWINKISFQESKLYIFAAFILLLEIYFLILLLPSNFYAAGLIFALAYYVIIGLIRYKLLNKFNKRVIIRYISISIFLFLLLLFTVKWR